MQEPQAGMFEILKAYGTFFIPKLPGGTAQEESWGRNVSISSDPQSL